MHTWGNVKCILDRTFKGKYGRDGQGAAGEKMRPWRTVMPSRIEENI
jgi:hypothetical protein